MRAKLAIWLIAASLLIGCAPTPEPEPPAPEPVPGEIVVGTSEQITATDPSGPSTWGNDLVYLDVFQRLMVVYPDGSLRPDAAQDCAFRQISVYECVLKKGLKFHNGHDLTSSDVRFSIERAMALKAPGWSNLASMRSIETPEPNIIRFNLAWSDSDFGQFLSMPSVGIVDEELYDAKARRPLSGLPIGSGPFQLVSLNAYQARFSRFTDYQGATPGRHEQITVKRLAGSAAGEAALVNAEVDVLWRTLTPSAVIRAQQPTATTPPPVGYTYAPIAGSRVFRVRWNTGAPLAGRDDVRETLAKSWQRDRTLDSLVPRGTNDYLATFPTGGTPKVTQLDETLKMQVSADSPGADELAWQLVGAAKKYGGLTIELTDRNPDLVLLDNDPPVNSAFGWLRYFVNRAEPRALDLEKSARTTLVATERSAAIQQLQKMAATKLIELPVAQLDNPLFLKSGVNLDGFAYGPGKQFVLWGLHK